MNKKSKTEIVKEYIINELHMGKITYGKRLPSCRQLANELSMNKITVNKAYDQLESEHIVYRIPRGGFYLVEQTEKGKKTDTIYDFKTVKPDEKLVPYREYTHCLNKAVEQYKNNIFGYEMSLGLPSLRDTLKTRLEFEGIYTSAENILIANGAQQAIHIALHTIFQNNGGKLLVENPTYSLVLKLANQLSIPMLGIERTKEGYDFKNLEAIMKVNNITAFYLIPRYHNPTGYSLSEKSKQKVVQLCNKYQVQIIEDDYLADLSSKKGSMPIHYYDTKKQVCYIRSFSKTFIPGIRIGTLISPKNITKTTSNYKQLMDLHTSILTQAALDIFIQSGMYEKHIRKVRKLYEKKLRKVKEILQSFDSKNVSFYVPEQGIFVWLQIQKEINENNAEKLLKNLQDLGVIIDFADECFIDPKESISTNSRDVQHKYTQPFIRKNCHCIRLCIAGIPEESLDKIIYILEGIEQI